MSCAVDTPDAPAADAFATGFGLPKADAPEASTEAEKPGGGFMGFISSVGDAMKGGAAGDFGDKDEPDPSTGFTQPLVDVSGPSAKLAEMGDAAPLAGESVDLPLQADPLKEPAVPAPDGSNPLVFDPSLPLAGAPVPVGEGPGAVPGMDAPSNIPGGVSADVNLPGAPPGDFSAPPLGSIEDVSAPSGTLDGVPNVPGVDVPASGVDASLDGPEVSEGKIPTGAIAAGAAVATAATAGAGVAAASALPSAPGVSTPDASPGKSKKSKLPSIGGFFKRKGSKKSIGEEGSASGIVPSIRSAYTSALSVHRTILTVG